MKALFFLFIVCIIVLGCEKEKSQQELVTSKIASGYSILVSEVHSLDSLQILKETIFSKWGINSFIKPNLQYSEKLLYVGKFSTAKRAWFVAEKLLSDSLLSDYQVTFNESSVDIDYNKMVFVSGYLNRPSLFEFDFRKKKSNMVWSHWGRKIIRLFPSTDEKKYFYNTGLTMGRSGGFPFITDARLYQYQKENNKVNRLNIYGDGIQFSGGWSGLDTFKTSFVMVDSFKTTTIIDIETLYDINGNPIDTNETVYDILVDGFPRKPKPALAINSPSEFYHIQSRLEVDKNIISIFKNKSEYLLTIDTTKFDLEKIVWSDEENYAAICAANNETSNKSRKIIIYLIDLINKKIITKIDVEFLKDVVFYGDYLLYDSRIKEKQVIEVYNCFNQKKYTTIELSKDCGIYSIPIKMSTIKSENLF